MLNWIPLLLGIFVLYYAGVMLAFAYGFQRMKRKSQRISSQPPTSYPSVSVIIPARDEAHVIARCLHSVFACDYPPDKLEVIVVDDLSKDDTPQIVQELQRQYASLRLLHMPENLPRTRAHKKRAIEKGIYQATGDIIMTTDADCIVPREWIKRMVAHFQPGVSFVSGPVAYLYQQDIWSQILALEFLGLVAIGAGAIGIRRPNMCNGANLAYRKDTFMALGGFSGIDHLTSGDDELLMQKIAEEDPDAVSFCADAQAIVLTEPVQSVRAFFEQRKRWASKGARYPSKTLVLSIAFIYLFYAFLLCATALSIGFPELLPVTAGAWMLKMGSELTLMLPAVRFFNQVRLLKWFIPAQVLQLPYVVLVGLAGTFWSYEWKDRTIVR